MCYLHDNDNNSATIRTKIRKMLRFWGLNGVATMNIVIM